MIRKSSPAYLSINKDGHYYCGGDRFYTESELQQKVREAEIKAVKKYVDEMADIMKKFYNIGNSAKP